MTYRSLFVEEHPSRESATAPYELGRDAPLFCRLNPYTWPISALIFAREHQLHTDYVDNCWVLVAVDATMLRSFLGAGAGGDADVQSTIARVNDNRWYVINEEEF